MKHPCATFSDTRHAVQTTKIGVPTQNTTENWTNKSWHFIYFRLHMYICTDYNETCMWDLLGYATYWSNC